MTPKTHSKKPLQKTTPLHYSTPWLHSTPGFSICLYCETTYVAIYSEHSSQRAKRVANDVSSYGRDMVQNGLGFMHSVSLKSHGPVLLSMKLLPYPVNQSCFPSALDKLNETALRRMVPAVTSLAN